MTATDEPTCAWEVEQATSQAVDTAIAAAVARLRREAADSDRLADAAARRAGLTDRVVRWRHEAGAYERAARLVAARGDVALEPEPDRKLPAETVDPGEFLWPPR